MSPEDTRIVMLFGVGIVAFIVASPQILRWWYGRKLRQLRRAFERHAEETKKTQLKMNELMISIDELKGLYVGRLYRVTYRQRETYSGEPMTKVMTARYGGWEPLASDSLVIRQVWNLEPDSQYGVQVGSMDETIGWELIDG